VTRGAHAKIIARRFDRQKDNHHPFRTKEDLSERVVGLRRDQD